MKQRKIMRAISLCAVCLIVGYTMLRCGITGKCVTIPTQIKPDYLNPTVLIYCIH
jgi:hypothetical protein